MKITNNNPAGRGCLRFLLWTHLFIPILIIIILATGFITLPSKHNVNKNQKSEMCIKNMENIHIAIRSYMDYYKKDFKGNSRDLYRAGYLKRTLECPENGIGDKYIIKGNYETGEITVRCPNEMNFSKHKLSKSFIDKK